jgi:biopolymer transport protein ExbB
MLCTAPAAQAWWNDGWAFRKELTFDTTVTGADLPEAVTDVPVLVRLSLANFTYFADAKPDGSDLRFLAADDKTPLKFHIEKYDAQAQIALIWVRLPQLAGRAKTDKIYLYYGNKSGAAAADAAGTYDANQALVYHFASATDGDSGPYKNQPESQTAEVTPVSLIGSGLHFSGDQHVEVKPAPSLRVDPAKGTTITAWIKPDSIQLKAVVAKLSDGTRELTLGIDGPRAYARWHDANGRDTVATQATDLAGGEWHHLALRAANGKLALLVDGDIAAQSDISLQEINAGVTIGAGYKGDLDELQVANTGRSDSWVRAAARSQGMQATLVTYGGDAQKDSGASQSYFASTLRNVTVDGWVIIGVLAVMFIASILIMLFKVLRLNSVASGNARFLEEFHRLRDDPAALERREGPKVDGAEDSAFSSEKEASAASAMMDDGSSFGASTLWRLYHHGMRETLKRVDRQGGEKNVTHSLSPQSIAAIRATMDASMTRMTQGLQSQMVWLTISISGGPFLGLLGTVVGVMITFAAIALAGEVNVNAIAPGTAAALVATVAGLGVAIPCLFGYNYLNTRIKDISTDMRVFVDEFVTRIAETYA